MTLRLQPGSLSLLKFAMEKLSEDVKQVIAQHYGIPIPPNSERIMALVVKYKMGKLDDEVAVMIREMETELNNIDIEYDSPATRSWISVLALQHEFQEHYDTRPKKEQAAFQFWRMIRKVPHIEVNFWSQNSHKDGFEVAELPIWRKKKEFDESSNWSHDPITVVFERDENYELGRRIELVNIRLPGETI